jgi:hypothetical protein
MKARKRPADGDMTDYRKARAMACPRCAAKPGNPCVNAYGGQMSLLHRCRWRAPCSTAECRRRANPPIRPTINRP